MATIKPVYGQNKSDIESQISEMARKSSAMAEAERDLAKAKAEQEAARKAEEERIKARLTELQEGKWNAIRERKLEDFLADGGREEDFNKVWPEIRRKMILDMADQAESAASKRQYRHMHGAF